ncbi:hypothetical protein SAMN05444274_1352 [Mariniphaga anaerophila]|uniref:Uncharacterized protein n=1 Tax=Mariniphaga anaerophila TaxID=1484053 RepID=A0A1M5GU68_9BACT|nr:hypothetical protein [Mariniphaga anaerophila]SHG07233.1 hypothetical protein SAMN05444274_1352 [Mariniphaga anaerophila]
MGLFNIFGKKNTNSIELKIDKKLPIGTSVNLWLKPDTNIVHIYEFGYLSGDGLIGQHENKKLATHLRNEKAFEAEVVADKKIEIKLLEKSKEEMLNDNYLKNEYPKLLDELSKPVRVKKIQARLYIDNQIKIEKGELIYPVFSQNIVDHLKERILKLEFKNGEGKIVGIKENEPNKIRQILRLHFANKAEFQCKIQNLKDYGNGIESEVLIEIN